MDRKMVASLSKLQRFVSQPRLRPYIAVVVVLLYRWWVRWRSRPRNVYIPVGRYWLLGSMAEFIDTVRAVFANRHLDQLLYLHSECGKTFAAKLPLQPWWVMTTCPNNVEHILSNNFPNYPKGVWFTSKLSDLLGHGIFNVDGKEWYSQRKGVSHLFSASLFKQHIWTVVRQNARKLRDILRSASATEPSAVDVFNLMNRFALDTICEIGFGKSIGSLEDPTSPFMRSFDGAQRIALKRFFTPHWRLLKWLGIGSERDTREHFSYLDEYARKVVSDLKANIAKEDDGAKTSGISWSDIEARKSLVGLFLADAKQRGEELGQDFLRDLVLNFLIAGRDATAQALSWTIYCLCLCPEAAEKAREEIKQRCGLRGPAYEDLDDLPYLQAVIDEALRLYPSLPLDLKTAANDDTWPDGSFVPKGTVVLFNMYAMGRDTTIWGEDASIFRPERWLDMERPCNYSYPVFNGGPRECLGKRLAHVEMITCLALLLPQMTFQLAVPPEEITHDGTLTIGMGKGLPCIVKPAEDLKDCEGSTSATQSESESIYSSGYSDAGDVTCEAEGAASKSRKTKSNRRSGRARQREKRRSRVSTPSPDGTAYDY